MGKRNNTIIISGILVAFLVGTITANPVVEAAGGWKAAFDDLINGIIVVNLNPASTIGGSSISTGDHTTDTNTNAGTICSSNELLDGDGNCQTIPTGGGGVTSVTASSPLSSSGGQNPNISLGVIGTANGGTGLTTAPTAPGQVLRSSVAGAWSIGSLLQSDLPSLSGLTSVIADSPILGDGTASDHLRLDSSGSQLRVSGTCPVGESIRVINQDGTVVCETGPIVGSWEPTSTRTGATPVIWDIEKINTDTSTFGFTSGADHILIKQSGTYLVTANVLTSSLSLGERSNWALVKNLGSICKVAFNAGGFFNHNNCTVITTFAAGDKLQLKNLSFSSSISGSPGFTSLSIQKLS